jgi:predicted permease
VRTALGASSGALAAGGVLEALLVALVGAAAGIAVAAAAVAAVPALAPGAFPRSDRVALDAGVAIFAVGLSVSVALLSGAREAWRRSRVHPWEALIHARGATAEGGSARRLLLALEVALSTVLVTGAALLLQSLGNLRRTPLGFEPAGVVTGDIVLPEERYKTPEQITAFFEGVRAAAKALPGVVEAGWTTTVPFWNPAGTIDVEVESTAPGQAPVPNVSFEAVSPGLLRAVGTPLLEGRDISDADREGAPPVALVNRAFQERFWREGSAVGRRVRLTGGSGTRPWITIVGMTEDARDQAIAVAPRPRISIPFRQLPEAAGRPSHYLSLMVRSSGDAGTLVRPLRAVVAAADPEVPLGAARTLSSEVHSAFRRPRLASRMTGAFAASALVLILVGLYGLLASSVARRFREIGIRVALGAPRRSVLRLVLREALLPVGAGLAAGFAGSAGAARLLHGLLHGVGTVDVVSLGAAAVAILLTAAASAVIPAARALRTDPAIVLRIE